MTKTFKLVAVIWKDITGIRDWLTTSQVEKRVCDCAVTVGFIVKQTAKTLHLASSWSYDDAENKILWNDVNLIPKECILKMQDLPQLKNVIPSE